MKQQKTKKTKQTPTCPSMLIDEFLKDNGIDEEELETGSEDEDSDYLVEEEIAQEEDDEILMQQAEEINGTGKKRTRGPTQCYKIHSRSIEERQEVILDDLGEPIGPDDKTVSDLSYFLGTIARNGDFCPLIYTNFKLLVKDRGDLIWKYINSKFIIPDNGQRVVFFRISDAWRRHKRCIKKNHFEKYSSLKERLKNRPETISITEFKKLMAYWANESIQDISKKNAVNRAKQKYLHRMGPISFARIRAQLRAKKEDDEEVTQAEMFIETRQSRKGKEVDNETKTAIAKLQESLENPNDCAEQAFQSLFGKEKAGRVRCYGKTATPSMLRKNE